MLSDIFEPEENFNFPAKWEKVPNRLYLKSAISMLQFLNKDLIKSNTKPELEFGFPVNLTFNVNV